jgi:hypothetical protein
MDVRHSQLCATFTFLRTRFPYPDTKDYKDKTPYHITVQHSQGGDVPSLNGCTTPKLYHTQIYNLDPFFYLKMQFCVVGCVCATLFRLCNEFAMAEVRKTYIHRSCVNLGDEIDGWMDGWH